MNFKVYVIILNWNGWKDTIECLESVLKITYLNYKIIVCDNCSTDVSIEKIKEWGKDQNIIELNENNLCYLKKHTSNVYLIKNEINKGYAGGNNVGIKFAMMQNDVEYIWILNNDTVVDKNALENLVIKCKTDTNIGICGSKMVYYNFHGEIQGYGGIYNKFFASSKYILNEKDINKMDYAIGASILVSKRFIESIGLMEEKYFLYYEELDWAVRSKEKFGISCASNSIVYHKEGATIGSSNNPVKRSFLSDYYGIRNRILFTRKFYRCYLPTVYMGLVLAMINRIRRNQFDRAWMIFKLMISGGNGF